MALYPKSMTFSGCPKAHSESRDSPRWPVSVDAVAYPRRMAGLIASRLMEPPNPSFPTARNLPFQPELGIHTPNRILEPFVGLISPCTRQKGGKLVMISESGRASP